MQSIEDLITEFKLTPDQAAKLKQYFQSLVVELLESLKQDNLQNFEETIDSVRNS